MQFKHLAQLVLLVVFLIVLMEESRIFLFLVTKNCIMLDISKKRDLGSGVDGDSQKTLPKIGVKAVQRLAGPTDSTSDSLLSSTIKKMLNLS
jgi:hypothetical protein